MVSFFPIIIVFLRNKVDQENKTRIGAEYDLIDDVDTPKTAI